MGISTHRTLKKWVTDPPFFRNVLVPPLIPAEDVLIMFYKQEKAECLALPPLPSSTDLGFARLFPGHVCSCCQSCRQPAHQDCPPSILSVPSTVLRAYSLLRNAVAGTPPGDLRWLLGGDDFDLLWPSSHLKPSASEVHLM